jgi:hypothetical protein
MNKREQVIEKLVTTTHLNVPERAALSTDSVRYSEVATVIGRVLEDTGYFPPNARPWQQGNVVHEGAILQKLPGGGFRLTLQRSHPIAPTVLAAKRESDFQNASAAIKAFVSLEWPKGIDGIAIKGLEIAI